MLLIRHKLNRHLLVRTHQLANVFLGAIRRAEEVGVKVFTALRLGIGHQVRRLVTVIHGHIVVWLAIAAQCLCRDGAGQEYDVISGSLQIEFTIVVITVRRIGTAVVIDLEENGVLSELLKLHNVCFTVGRHLHLPHRIETGILCG